MVVLDQFFHLSERETSHVSSNWKVLHVVLFIVAAVSGFITAFAFGRILADFKYFCVLKADIVFSNDTYLPLIKHELRPTEKLDLSAVTTQEPIATTDLITDSSTDLIASSDFTDSTTNSDFTTQSPNVTTTVAPKPHSNLSSIDLTHTRWGAWDDCNFCQFTHVASMIFAIVWGTFFMIIAKGGSGYSSDVLPQPWKIVYPCMAFCLIFSIVHLASTSDMTEGFVMFCKRFKPQLHNSKCIEKINLYTLQFHEEERDFFAHYNIAVVFAYVGLCTWIAQLALLILRVLCIADFKLYLIKVSEKEEEYVQHVIELDDSEDLDEDDSQV